MIKVKEVYTENAKFKTDKEAYSQPHMRARRIYNRRDCLLNADYIVAVYPHKFESSVDEGMLQDHFTSDTEFTRVILDGNSFRSSEIIVEMPYAEMAERLS
jgi:Rad3-related DNA helicase